MEGVMKCFALAILFLATTAYAVADPFPPDACGNASVQFKVKNGRHTPLDSPAAGSAQIVVLEEYETIEHCIGCQATIRIGENGKWDGALEKNSYLVIPVDAGSHHLCASWQSRILAFEKYTKFQQVDVRNGETYFLKAHIWNDPASGPPFFKLEPLDPSEAKMLLSSRYPAVATKH
jgi:hypothetical protein